MINVVEGGALHNFTLKVNEVALHLFSKLITTLVVAGSLSDLLIFPFRGAALALLGFSVVALVRPT